MTKGSGNRRGALRVRNLIPVFLALSAVFCQAQTNPPGVVSNLALGSNFNLKVSSPDLEFPLIIKFKSYKPGTLTVQDLLPPVARTNILTRTNTVTNRVSPVVVSASNTNGLAVSKNSSKKKKKKGDEEKIYNAAVALFNHGEFPSAVVKFGDLLALAPDGEFGDSSRIYLSRMQFASNRMDQAVSTLGLVTKKKSEAAYWKVLFMTQKTNDTAAIEVYEARKQEEEYDRPFFDMVRVVARSFLRKKLAGALIADIEGFLKNPAVAVKPDPAVFALAELYEKDKQNRNMKKAFANYDLVAVKYSSSPFAPEARRRADFIRKNFLEIR